MPPHICWELEKLASLKSTWYWVGGFGSADRLRFGFFWPAVKDSARLSDMSEAL